MIVVYKLLLSEGNKINIYMYTFVTVLLVLLIKIHKMYAIFNCTWICLNNTSHSIVDDADGVPQVNTQVWKQGRIEIKCMMFAH